MPYPSSLPPNPAQASKPILLVPATLTNAAPASAVTGSLFIVLPVSLVLIVFSYKKYRAAQRSRLLKRQIALLEAMWRLSSTKRRL